MSRFAMGGQHRASPNAAKDFRPVICGLFQPRISLTARMANLASYGLSSMSFDPSNTLIFRLIAARLSLLK